MGASLCAHCVVRGGKVQHVVQVFMGIVLQEIDAEEKQKEMKMPSQVEVLTLLYTTDFCRNLRNL